MMSPLPPPPQLSKGQKQRFGFEELSIIAAKSQLPRGPEEGYSSCESPMQCSEDNLVQPGTKDKQQKKQARKTRKIQNLGQKYYLVQSIPPIC